MRLYSLLAAIVLTGPMLSGCGPGDAPGRFQPGSDTSEKTSSVDAEAAPSADVATAKAASEELHGVERSSQTGISAEEMSLIEALNDTSTNEVPEDADCDARLELMQLAPEDSNFYNPRSCLDATDLNARESLKFLNEVEVYHGTIVDPGLFPETVLITRPNQTAANFTTLCTGVLLSPTVIITAAHCYKSNGAAVIGSNVSFGNDWESAGFRTTIVDARSALKATGADMALARLKVPAPEQFVPASLASSSDIAASQAFPLGPAILSQEADVEAALGARAVGFGLTEEGEFGTKLRVDLAVVSNDCSGQGRLYDGRSMAASDLYGCRQGAELIAGAAQRRPGVYSDTCGGDSGGPLFVADAANAQKPDYFATINDRYFLAGITKRAVNTRYIPAGGRPYCGNGGIYTLLTGANRKWIEDTMLEWGEIPRIRSD